MVTNIEKIQRIHRIQEARLILIGVLSFFSVIYMSVICFSLYIDIPMWLITLNIVCLLFNAPLIWWLLSLYIEQRKRINNK